MKIGTHAVAASALTLLVSAIAITGGAHGQDSAKQMLQLPEICQRVELTCLPGEHSLIIGPPGQPSLYVGLIEKAEKLYDESFNSPRVNTVLFLAAVVSEEDREILRDAGYEVLLPWLSGLARQEMARGAIRAQVTAQNSGASEAEIETMTEAVLERAGLAMNADVEHGAISHELAHMWFIKSNWPSSDQDENEDEETRQYGSGAPDWLDEMAAVLSENAFLVDQRRQTTKEIVAKGDLEAFWPLDTYFAMEHPIYRQTLAMLEARGDLREGMNVVMITGEQARGLDPEDGRESPHFYAQSRSFADFMIETTNSTYVFDTIARALGNGMSMDAWLSENGQQCNLGTTLPALQKQWETWLVETYVTDL